MYNIASIGAEPETQLVRLEAIKQAKNAILNCCTPLAIYLFGSAATDFFFEDSDIDCLVVFELEQDSARFWKLYSRIRRQTSRPLDLISMSLIEFERKRDLGGIAFIAWNEGIQIFPESLVASTNPTSTTAGVPA